VLVDGFSPSDAQRECIELVEDVLGRGRELRFKPAGRGVTVSVLGGLLATFDHNRLTFLVILAHDRCIRLEIVASGPCRVGLMLHKRPTRNGLAHERHPTLEQAIGDVRAAYPQPVSETA